MDIVYTQDGTVAAVVVGQTSDGHPVVVELGKCTVLSPLAGGADHNPAVHGYSYDIASDPSPGITGPTTPTPVAAPSPAAVVSSVFDIPSAEVPAAVETPVAAPVAAPVLDTGASSSEQRIEQMLGSFLGELSKALAPAKAPAARKPAARRKPATTRKR